MVAKPQVNIENLPEGRHNFGKGLSLNVQGRSRAWSTRFSVGGKPLSRGLGAYPGVTEETARERMAELWAKHDYKPRSKRTKSAPARATATRRETPTEYEEVPEPGTFGAWASHTLSVKVCADKTRREWKARMRTYADALWSMPIETITLAHILNTLTASKKGGISIPKKILSNIREVLDEAMLAGAIEANPAAGSAVIRGMKRRDLIYKPTHHPYTPWPKARNVAEQLSVRLRDEGGPGRVLLFILLTATRGNEATGARWEEINRKERIWTIPAERTKTRTQHRVPLSNQAMELLYGKGRETGGARSYASLKGSEFVFPASYKPNRAIHHNKTTTLRKELLGKGTTHGLRSTFRTYCADHGVARDVAEACLGHIVGNSTERSYQRSDIIERRREVMQQWADFVLPPPDQVAGGTAAGAAFGS